MSDKSWEPGSFLMFSYVFQCFLTFSNVTYSHSHLSHSLTINIYYKLLLPSMFNSLAEEGIGTVIGNLRWLHKFRHFIYYNYNFSAC